MSEPAGPGPQLRAALASGLLAPALLDFQPGGGVMHYHKPRPALPADLEQLVANPSLQGLKSGTEHTRICAALIMLGEEHGCTSSRTRCAHLLIVSGVPVARGALDAAHDIVGEEVKTRTLAAGPTSAPETGRN